MRAPILTKTEALTQVERQMNNYSMNEHLWILSIHLVEISESKTRKIYETNL